MQGWMRLGKTTGKAAEKAVGCAGALVLFAFAAAGAQHKLDLQQALPLDGPVLVQPSGLAWDGKNLLMVSSFHDEEIFKIELQAHQLFVFMGSPAGHQKLQAPSLYPF